MPHLDTHRTAYADHGARFSASDRPIPPARPGDSASAAGSLPGTHAPFAARARIAAAMIALVALVALAGTAPTALLVLLTVVAITAAVVGGTFLLVERQTRSRDATADRPSYFTADRLPRREA
jgi:hypothetical protein